MSVYIIAEAGVNHNGDRDMAFQLVDIAADSGADAVKFQTFKADKMITKVAAKAAYQKENTEESESQYEMLKKLELSYELHIELKDYARDKGVEFLSTAFDDESLEFLVSHVALKTLKISSGELTNHPFLLKHAQTGCDIILSTGMATIDEVEAALSVLAYGFISSKKDTPSLESFKKAYKSNEGRSLLKEKVTILHCTSEYPTPLKSANLKVMRTLDECFDLKVGYSDHTLGTDVASLAVAVGAEVLEKHFTIDKSLKGPDHAMALSPVELTEYVQRAREAETVLGDGDKSLSSGELKNRSIGRKVIVASKAIKKGEVFSESNLSLKRNDETGLKPEVFWDLIGKKAKVEIPADSALSKELVLNF